MPTYRIRCGGHSIDIVADSPSDAVLRTKDMEYFRTPNSERRFQIYEILRFDTKRFAGRAMPEGLKQWYGAEEKYLETIVSQTPQLSNTVSCWRLKGYLSPRLALIVVEAIQRMHKPTFGRLLFATLWLMRL